MYVCVCVCMFVCLGIWALFPVAVPSSTEHVHRLRIVKWPLDIKITCEKKNRYCMLSQTENTPYSRLALV